VVDTPETIDAVFRDAFEDVALLIGNAAAVHRLDDTVVWMLLRRLERVRLRTLYRLPLATDRAGCASSRGIPYDSHPAVEAFLLRNRGDRHAGRDSYPQRPEQGKEPRSHQP
jgi:hypothetical protein